MKHQENGLPVGYEAVIEQQRKLKMETALEVRCPSVRDQLAIIAEQEEINRFLKIASQI